MPFTISHAAAVLPLRKTGLPLAAMMVGSLAPDFAYFLRFGLERVSTHDLQGILLFCWPVGLAVWLFYVYVLEPPTIELLPEAWRTRVTPSDRNISFRMLALGSIAVIVGAITHVLWDAFTHGGTFVTNAFPAFHNALFEYRGRAIRVYFILQILSSIVGLFALWLWALNLRRGAPRIEPLHEPASFITNRVRILAVLTIVVSAGVMALVGYAGTARGGIEARFFYFLIGGMAGGFMGWCAIAVLIRLSIRHALTREEG